MKIQKKKSGNTEKLPDPENTKNPDTGFPIIGIGASAGGLEAFEQFFRNMPPDSGMAFILITHLDPDHPSMMTEILQRITEMPVHEAQDQMAVMQNHVYVIPPNRDMSIFHSLLHLSIPENPRGLRMPIDFFLRSLAEEQGERAIGVILSGNGSDGTLGLRAIHGAGGITFVQEPSSARYDGMPVSAIRSGLAAYILPVEKMPEQLISYKKTFRKKKIKSDLPAPVITGDLSKILMLIRSRTGHDFSLYKQSTIRRRIERRMTIHCIEDVNIYARFLKENPDEIMILFKELLINVTNFFRDTEAFAVLKKDILPKLFADKPDNYVFRIWCAGCASGEEAYSIAIIFREYMDESGQDFKVQIYATDLDDDAVKTARAGIYPANIAIDVSAERLRHFFMKEELGYRVRKDIREMIVFATHNVIKDPPFNRLDMLICRNMLIYFEAELQNMLIPIFHYALKPDGILFLSTSESIGQASSDLFVLISRQWKFYQAKTPISSTHKVLTHGFASTGSMDVQYPESAKKKTGTPDFAELIQKELLRFYAPSSVISDENGNILFIHGETGKYLKPAPGKPGMNLFEMAREGLQSELSTAIRTAALQKKEVIFNACPVKTDGGIHEVNLTVRPLTVSETYPTLLMVSFADVHPLGKPARKRRNVKPSKRTEELEQELLYTKENLHATIEEMQAANEELKSGNEELQSTNEELQSTNEEMETSKEELQSVNEELITVNSELQSKIGQLAGMQSDMKNLLDSINIGTIFLDTDLVIKRFTREAVNIFRLAASDIGRPLSDIKSDIISKQDISDDIQAVLDSLIPREKEILTIHNRWYMLRIMPYRTLENVIDGVVMTFTDVTERRKIQDEIQAARQYLENIVDTIREPLIVLDADFKVISASRSFYGIFHVTEKETIGNSLFELGSRQWDIPRLRELLETILPKDTSFENMEMAHDFPIIGHKKMLLNARRIPGQTGKTKLILLAIEDDLTPQPPSLKGQGE